VLTHWKEREPVYKAREARIRSQFGGEVPAYAVATAGAPVDVAPKEQRGRRDRLTQPADPTQGVSRQDFEEMVRDLGIEEEEAQPAATPSGRPAGGRRARSRGNGGAQGAPRPPKPPAAGGGDGDGEKPKKPRNRRHGRPR
jgi:SecD/SecF fusion protein